MQEANGGTQCCCSHKVYQKYIGLAVNSSDIDFINIDSIVEHFCMNSKNIILEIFRNYLPILMETKTVD